MIYPNEPASAYHERPSVSAGLLWDIVKPDGCEALAWFNSPWLNPDHVPVTDEVMLNGQIAHLAILEPEKMEAQITVIDARDFRSATAKLLRDEAIATGKIPILNERDPGSTLPSFQKILGMRKALTNSYAEALLFGNDGNNEISYTFDLGVPCKCRADRIILGEKSVILDLKTAVSASPDYFQRAMVNFGHHLRASFYLDGWASQQEAITHPIDDYLFVVVQRDPPHLVSIFDLDEHSLTWGERLWQAALERFKQAQENNLWPGFMHGALPKTMTLPTWATHALADREAAGEFE
jgi:hypothetical protein